MRLSTGCAANHCPADAVMWSGPRRQSGRGRNEFQSFNCRRGREDIVRGRRLAGARARRLNFTVRRRS